MGFYAVILLYMGLIFNSLEKSWEPAKMVQKFVGSRTKNLM